jgi:nucleotide-binding universal stress UspA family protein
MKIPRIRNILVPIDFSASSTKAIETAKRLAQRFGATVHLVHVHQFDYPAGFMAPMPPLMPFSTVAYDQDIRKKQARRLVAVAKEYGLSPATCHVVFGAPAFEEICRFARDLPANLIVTSTHGHTGLKHVFLGSTAEGVVQNAPCPVFVARQNKGAQKKGKEPPSLINTILVPVDFSRYSLEGLQYAVSFAEEFAARIKVFHTVRFGYRYTGDSRAMPDLSELKKVAQRDAAEQMRNFVSLVKFGRVEFETAVVIGSPAQEICTFAERQNVDLIITATHGRTGLRHILIGSVAERVVRTAPCPVLVVPSHSKSRLSRMNESSHPARIEGGIRQRPTPTRTATGKLLLTKRDRKLMRHAFPERRKTNKFRETHPGK